jgi:putative transposase
VGCHAAGDPASELVEMFKDHRQHILTNVKKPAMPTGLHRCHDAGYLHFITTSCYQRLPMLGTQKNRDLFLEVLEQVRRRYHFVVVGYVVMPEHVHLLVSEPEREDTSLVMQVLKQGFARRLLCQHRREGDPRQEAMWELALRQQHIWQKRYYDFVVWSAEKRWEKLHYIHQNPVRRGLVLEPKHWRWSSARDWLTDEAGPVLVNEAQRAEMKVRPVA